MKYIQIVSFEVPVYATFKHEDGTQSKSRVHIAALCEDGTVAYLESDSHGNFMPPDEVSNFTGYEFPEDAKLSIVK